MINDINKNNNDAISEMELVKNKSEMMRYRTNDLSYKLGFGALLFSILGAFILLNSMNPIEFTVLVKILMNIAILLIGFLCCEKAKAYNKVGCITLMVLGGINIARIFWVPVQLYVHYNPWHKNMLKRNEIDNVINGNNATIKSNTTQINDLNSLMSSADTTEAQRAEYQTQIAELTASNETLTASLDGLKTQRDAYQALMNKDAKYLGQTITGYDNAKKGTRWLSESGNVRATLALVFLICSAGLFIAAGVIGYIKSAKLEKYLKSINIKK